MAPNRVKFKPTSSHVRQVRSCPWVFLSLLCMQISRFWEMLAYLESANMSRICPPSSRVSPICHSAEPYGQGNTRLSHIKRRRLIMPLVALVQKKQSAPATAYKFWCSALPSSSPLLLAFRLRTSECFKKFLFVFFTLLYTMHTLLPCRGVCRTMIWELQD